MYSTKYTKTGQLQSTTLPETGNLWLLISGVNRLLMVSQFRVNSGL